MNTWRLQQWQLSMGTPSCGTGNSDSVKQDSPEHVGIIPQSPNRSVARKDEKQIKIEESVKNDEMGKEKKKISRQVEDGLLLVVSARIYGK